MVALVSCDETKDDSADSGLTQPPQDKPPVVINDPKLDIDDDGVVGIDNCPEMYNPDQADSDGNGVGDACDAKKDEPKPEPSPTPEPPKPEPPKPEPKNPYFSENKVDFFAGSYSWAGYSEGMTTEGFIKSNNIDMTEIFKLSDPGFGLYDAATSANAPPAHTANIRDIAYYRDGTTGNEFLYYSMNSLLYKIDLKDNFARHVAFKQKYGYKDGNGKEALSGYDQDIEAASYKFGPLILPGNVLIVDYGYAAIRLVKEIEGSSYVQTLISFNFPVEIGSSKNITKMTMSKKKEGVDGRMFVLSTKPWEGKCDDVYEIYYANNTYNYATKISKNALGDLMECNDIKADSKYLYVIGKRTDGKYIIREFDLEGVQEPQDIEIPHGLYSAEWLPNGDGFILGGRYNIYRVNLTDHSAALVAGSTGNPYETGWMERPPADSIEKIRVDGVKSITGADDGRTLFIWDSSNKVIRRVSFDESGTLKSSSLVLGIPYTSYSGIVDGELADKARFNGYFYGSYLDRPPENSGYIGDLYVSNYKSVRKIRLGTKDDLFVGTETVLKAMPYIPTAIYVDAGKNIYTLAHTSQRTGDFADAIIVKINKSDMKPEKILAEGDFNTLGIISAPSITGMAYLNGSFYLTDSKNYVVWSFNPVTNEIKRVAGGFEKLSYPPYGKAVKAEDARFILPGDITTMNGKLYVYDNHDETISEMAFGEDGAKVKKIAGSGARDHIDGTGDKAYFEGLMSLAPYIDNKLLVSERVSGTVRMIDTVTHEVTTIAGQPYMLDVVDGKFNAAQFFDPLEIECIPEIKSCLVADGSALRVLK